MTASQLALHLGAVGLLTMATGPGGLAWVGAALLARLNGMRMQAMLLAFGLFYGLIWGAAQVTAPVFGRAPLPCTGAPLRMQSPLYCLLMRNFVTPDMRDVAMDAARAAPPRPSAPLPLNGSAMRHAPRPFPPCAGTWAGSSPWSART